MANHERTYEKSSTSRERDAEALFTRLREKGMHYEHELKRYSENVDTYIKKNPVKSTLIAGVLGLMLGKLLSK